MATSLVPRLASALALADPEQAWARVQATLLECGVATGAHAAVEGGASWLEIELGDRKYSFVASGDAPPADELTQQLLRAALLRLHEHEQQRRLSERLEMLSSASFEGIFVHVDGMVIDVNQRLCELGGYAYEELLGAEMLRRCTAPEDLPEVYARMQSRYEGAYVITAVRRDGSRFRAELQSKQGKLGDRPVRVVAVRDVTERERMLRLLNESERRLRDLAEEAFDVTVFSRDGVVIDVDERAQGLMGYPREEVIGRKVLDFVAPSAAPLAGQVLAEQRVGSYETMIVHRDGTPIPVEVIAVTSTLDGEPVRVAGLRDRREATRLADERHKLEQQLVRSQRLESLGVLAGGIAHDFNNLLVGVLGNAELLIDRIQDPFDRRAAEDIRTAGERAADLIKQMLAYAGQRDAMKREPVDLALLARELQQLLGATLSKKARVVLSIAPDSVVLGDRATVMQVLMNLLTNASDALQDKAGTIEVRTERVYQPDARWDDALGATVSPGEWVLLEVSDGGIGMDEATRARVFEPFFSTKETGHGLGLAACLGIVSAHGGAIRVESQAGQGSCFSVLLPSSKPASVPAARPELARGRPCRVLVVDDEAVVRSQVRRSLELRGYSVEEASGGQHALSILEQSTVDVILLDMTMQDLDGAEVARRIRQRGSQVPIVLASGYLQIAWKRGLERDSVQGFLRKPFRVAELLEVIEQALASAAG